MSLIAAAAMVAALSQPATAPASLQEPQAYEDLLCGYADWDCAKAYRVMLCESSGNPRAYAAGNYGLMQVNGIHAHRVGGNPAAFYDPATNIEIAHQLWQERGWQPWGYCGRR
jgi:soluble lytic murein transglycosylase-like protein